MSDTDLTKLVTFQSDTDLTRRQLPRHFVLEYEEQDSYYNATPRLSPSSTAYSATPRNFTPRTPRPPHAPPQGVRAIIRRKTWDGKVDQEAFEHVLAGAQHKP